MLAEAARAAGRCGSTLIAGGIARSSVARVGLVASSLRWQRRRRRSQHLPRPASGATLTANAHLHDHHRTPTAAIKAPTPTLEPLPQPAGGHSASQRDKDGALTAAGRPKGDLAPPHDHRQR